MGSCIVETLSISKLVRAKCGSVKADVVVVLVSDDVMTRMDGSTVSRLLSTRESDDTIAMLVFHCAVL